VELTKSLCPALLSESKGGVECPNHHIQYVIGIDVPVLDSGVELDNLDMEIPNARGNSEARRLDFRANVLLPYVPRGRLSDLLEGVPKYQNLAFRYPLYTTVFPQLVDAVRSMHSAGFVHLGVDPSTVLCVDVDCDTIYVTDFSKSSRKDQSTPSAFANEMYQESIRIASVESNNSDEEYEEIDASAIEQFKAYALKEKTTFKWDSARQVDWYSVGATCYYVLAQQRYTPDVIDSTRTKHLAEFIYISFTKNLMGKSAPTATADLNVVETLSKIRNYVTEGLLVVDGLLVTDRSKRISFDDHPNQESTIAETTTNNLRSGRQLMSSLQLDAKNAFAGKAASTTCASFVQTAVKESNVINQLPIQSRDDLPSFMQNVC
jgi:serine/threonine protein kinase